MKNTHGGRREGSGAKTGSKWARTLTKEAARELVRQKVTEHLDALLDAQIANATGLKYLVARDEKTGKFERIGAAALDGSRTRVEVWEKDPNVQAFSDLVNRAIDKPKEQAQEIQMTMTLEERKANLRGVFARVKADPDASTD